MVDHVATQTSSISKLTSLTWLFGALIALLLITTIIFRTNQSASETAASELTAAELTAAELTGQIVRSNGPLIGLSGQTNSDADSRSVKSSPGKTQAKFTTTIRRPSGPPTIELDQADPQGRTGSIACSTCHSVREPNFETRVPTDLDQFHQNMQMAHGTLTCYSCHNPKDADTLRLADSTTVQYPDVMTLCSQCHGTQARDYDHGLHGGMNGYWDLSRGPRTRNNCIDCHDPHVPKFPSMKPTFKPRDRFLTPNFLKSSLLKSSFLKSTEEQHE